MKKKADFSSHSPGSALLESGNGQKGERLQFWSVSEWSGNNGQSNWVFAWSDLMMVLFVLFSVLFVYTLNHPQIKHVFHEIAYEGEVKNSFGEEGQTAYRVAGGKTISDPRIRSIYHRVSKVFSSFSRESISIGYTQASHVTMRLKNKKLFRPGKSELVPQAQPLLKKVSSVLEMISNEVQIVGHVAPQMESVSDTSSMWGLSAERSGKVAEYFIENGFRAERFKILAVANTEPLVPADGDHSKQINNRLEIRIMAPSFPSSEEASERGV